MSPYLLKRLWRSPWLSLCSLVLAAALSFLLCYLSAYRQEQEEKLIETQESFRIPCVVSDLQGTSTNSLRMGFLYYSILADEEGALWPYVKDVEVTKEFEYEQPLLKDESEALLCGINSLHCAQRLDPELGRQVQLPEDFFTREDLVCLVSEENYLKLGEEKDFSVFISDPKTGNPGDNFTLTAVGYYAGQGSEIYLPFPAAEKLMEALSGALSCDSLRFYVKDNQQLSQLSQAASQYFGQVDPTASDYGYGLIRYAMTIHDEQYRTTVGTLEQNIRRTGLFLPMLLLLCLLLGCLISFLSTRSRERSYALMRSQGVSVFGLCLTVLAEQVLLPWLGIALVGLALGSLLPAALCLLCYGLGCIFPLIRAVKTPPLQLLREQE